MSRTSPDAAADSRAAPICTPAPTPASAPIVTPSTIVTHAPRMGAPLGSAPAAPTMHVSHVSHDRKARDLG
jgi:hypothetical protein